MRKADPRTVTIRQAQIQQPWTVPYNAGIDIARLDLVPHILGSHTALHAMKSVGKIATVFEALDHSRSTGVEGKSEPMTPEHLATIKAMSADLMTAALRFANLYSFDLATVLLERIKEKNGVELEVPGDTPPQLPFNPHGFS